jgi:hypothetical protein
MSGKQAKKLRQLARRQENKQVKDIMESVHKTLHDLVKPAPRWIPTKVWRGVAKVFLNI